MKQQRHYAAAAAPGGMRRSLVLVCVLLSPLLLLQHGAKAADTAAAKTLPRRGGPIFSNCADPINGRRIDCTSMTRKKACRDFGGCCKWDTETENRVPQCVVRHCHSFNRVTCRKAPHCGWSSTKDQCNDREGCASMGRQECKQRWQYCAWKKEGKVCSAHSKQNPPVSPLESNTGIDGEGCQDLPKEACKYFQKPENGKLCVFTLQGNEGRGECITFKHQVDSCKFGNNKRNRGTLRGDRQTSDPKTRCEIQSKGHCVWEGDLISGDCIKNILTLSPTKSPTRRFKDVRCFSLAGTNPEQCCISNEKDQFVWEVNTKMSVILGDYAFDNEPQFAARCNSNPCSGEDFDPIGLPETTSASNKVRSSTNICTNPKLGNARSHDCAWCPYHWNSPRCTKSYLCPSSDEGPSYRPGCGFNCRRALSLVAAADALQKEN